jgi:hypothetical protein
MIWVEGRNLRLEQKLAEQYRQRDRLMAEQASLRVSISRLAAPAQIMEGVRAGEEPIQPPQRPNTADSQPSLPPYYNR